MRTLKLYINGQFVESEGGETLTSINPANAEPIAIVPWATPRDAARAVSAARQAFDSGPWPRMSGSERRKVLDKVADLLGERADEFALMEVEDAGALLTKAKMDVALCVSQLRYFAKMGERINGEFRPVEGMQKEGRAYAYTVREPIGVCAQIIPWNFPLTMAVWKIGPALATGNTVVLKCAPETPVTALELARLCHEAGVPPGVINVITGDADVGEAIVTDPKVDKVAFTGSTEIGRRVMALAAQSLKKVTLECGGKSANIVLDDATQDLAIDGSLYATFFHAGQVCESGTRLLLSEKNHDQFMERLISRASCLKVGDPCDPETTVGPVVSERQMNRVLRYIETGKREGASIAIGGARAQAGALSKGFFINPTIFVNVDPTHTIAREEIFGPVLSVLRYSDTEHAVRIANDTIYGLAAGVWSADIQKARVVASQLRAGWVWINEWHVLTPTAPFGGYKQSGIGREFGEEGINAYTEVKTIYQDDMRKREGRFWYDVVIPQANI